MVDETKGSGAPSTATIAGSADGSSSLENYIASNGPMNWRECFAQFHDVCVQMEANPECTGEIGTLTIHDFIVRKTDTKGGIAIVPFPSKTNQGLEKVKPENSAFPREAYMSPEKCLDRPVNRRSDMYSLGCVIYHCLTGAPPFMHSNTEKLKEMHAIEYALPPGRRSQRRVIPDEVDSVIENCLEKDPAKRVKNAGLLRASLGKVLQLDDESEDEPSPRSKKYADLSQKKRKIFNAVAALVLVMVCVAWWSLNVTSSNDFQRLVQRTSDRKKNKYFLGLEHGPQFVAQAEFGNGKMVADIDKDPIEIKVKDEDVVIFATTKRETMKDALEEAVRRRLIIYKADLVGQNLQGIKIPGGNLEHCFMIGSNLDGADLRGSNLKQSIFAGSSMKGALLSSVNSPGSRFQGCNLEGANLSSAVLIDSDFSKSNLKNADLSFSTFSNSSFAGADLTGAILKGATLSKTSLATANLTEDQKSGIKVIEGPLSNSKQLEQEAKGLNLVRPKQPTVNLRDQNPFSNPVEGTGAFGPSKNEPVGLNFDINNLPPAPPRKQQAPRAVPQPIPGQPSGNPAPAATPSAPAVP